MLQPQDPKEVRSGEIVLYSTINLYLQPISPIEYEDFA